eukprot:TRINITY_DN6462_c0_g1_i1.p1 TRINITY_DN6462_c0_g1~~TRINITY_DN6462_c0_g1_i1.p1  ORF type:complete len:1016 (+),score=223.04 TRINITY_DN6462_c0_g1_i1:66-3113(+)
MAASGGGGGGGLLTAVADDVAPFVTVSLVLLVGAYYSGAAAFALFSFLEARHNIQVDPSRLAARVKFLDKVFFVLGVVNVGLTTYFIGKYPQYFYLWFSFKCVVLLFTRFCDYRKERTHYFMFDFCYFANLLFVMFSWFFPSSPLLFRLLFVVANGPLAWSIIAFSNSAVFHSRSHMTSLFIHISPVMLSYCLRWYPSHFDTGCVNLNNCHENPLRLFWRAFLYVYLVWFVLYYVWVFVILGPRAKEKKNKTLFDWFTSKGPGLFIAHFHPNDLVNKFLYMVVHCFCCCIALFLGALLWNSFVAHTTFLITLCFYAVWEGAEHYFQSFASQYETDLRLRFGIATSGSQAVAVGALDESIVQTVQKWVTARCGDGATKSQVDPRASLTRELGLNSIQLSEIKGLLEKEFHVPAAVPLSELDTVAQIATLAARGGGPPTKAEPAPSKWFEPGLRARIENRIHKKGKDGAVAEPVKPTLGPRTAPRMAAAATIPLCFIETAARVPHAVSIADSLSGVFTYNEHLVAVSVFADFIIGHPDLIAGTNVGVMLPSSCAASFVYFALVFAKRVPVMINWTVGPRNLQAVVETAGVRVVLTSRSFLQHLGPVDLGPLKNEGVLIFLEDIKDSIFFFDMIMAKLRSSPTAVRSRYHLESIKPDDTAVILFTSGSEAAPKGVPLTHRNVLEDIRGALAVLELGADDALLGALPPFHSFGFTTTVVLPAVIGIKAAYSPNPVDYPQLAREIFRWKATAYLGTPTFLAGVLASATDEQTASLRLLVSGAERTPQSLFDEVRRRHFSHGIIEGYGITECSPVISLNVPFKPAAGVGYPIGCANVVVADAEVLISDHVVKELLPDQEGLLLVSGPTVFSGYLGKNAADPFVDHHGCRYYNTGDLGRKRTDGAVFISGRLKRFAKVAGEMVSLGAVEEALRARWPSTKDGPLIAVEAIESADCGPTQICAFSTCGVSREQCVECLRDAGLAPITYPTMVSKVDEIPLLGTGKTDYVHLKALLRGMLAQSR